MDIQKKLFEMQDEKYRDFHAKLMPNIEKSRIIGVRVPQIRNFAKEIGGKAEGFLQNLPHYYYEENNLHAILLSGISDFDECIKKLNEFLPYVDNWATCDIMKPKCFKKNRKKLLFEIEKWLKSKHEYTVRFAIEMLMTHFLDDAFDSKYLEKVSSVKSDKYYINMMIAWYFATALAKQWDSAVKYIEDDSLEDWVKKKAVQKAKESCRITSEQKKYLKNLIK